MRRITSQEEYNTIVEQLSTEFEPVLSHVLFPMEALLSMRVIGSFKVSDEEIRVQHELLDESDMLERLNPPSIFEKLRCSEITSLDERLNPYDVLRYTSASSLDDDVCTIHIEGFDTGLNEIDVTESDSEHVDAEGIVEVGSQPMIEGQSDVFPVVGEMDAARNRAVEAMAYDLNDARVETRVTGSRE